jgi:hypothetical protein
MISAGCVLGLRLVGTPPEAVAVNILNKQSWTSSLGFGRGLINPHSENPNTFHGSMKGAIRLAERLLASQEGLFSM